MEITRNCEQGTLATGVVSLSLGGAGAQRKGAAQRRARGHGSPVTPEQASLSTQGHAALLSSSQTTYDSCFKSRVHVPVRPCRERGGIHTTLKLSIVTMELIS